MKTRNQKLLTAATYTFLLMTLSPKEIKAGMAPLPENKNVNEIKADKVNPNFKQKEIESSLAKMNANALSAEAKYNNLKVFQGRSKPPMQNASYTNTTSHRSLRHR